MGDSKSGGKQLVIQPGSPEFQSFSRQFRHLLLGLPKTVRIVPVSVVLAGWVISDEYENYWFEIVCLVPEDQWHSMTSAIPRVEYDIIESLPSPLFQHTVRARLFYTGKRVDIADLKHLSDEYPKQPFLDVNEAPTYPFHRPCIKGLENIKPSQWVDAAKKLTRGEAMLSRRNLRPGRPRGTGWFKNMSEFKTALGETLAACTKEPTQLELLIKLDAHRLCRLPSTKERKQSDTKLLRNWIQNAGFGDFQNMLEAYFTLPSTGK